MAQSYPKIIAAFGLITLASLLMFQNCSSNSGGSPNATSTSDSSTASGDSGGTTVLGSAQAPMANPIVARAVNGQGVFVDSVTGNLFSPRGANYIRLASNGWHQTFDQAAYDSAKAETELNYMQSSGYNYVRVFLDGNDINNGFGLTTPGLPSYYVNNVADFITRAANHKIRVMLTGPFSPKNYQSIVDSVPAPNVSGQFNTIILHLGYAKAQAQFLTDLLAGLKKNSPATLNSIMAIDLFNETAVSLADPPLSMTSGTFSLGGKTYDLSQDASRQDLVDTATVNWANTLTAAIKAQAPGILVGASVYTPAALGGKAYNGVHCLNSPCTDSRYPIRPLMLMRYSDVDYVDVHDYPNGVSGSFSTDMASAEIYTGSVWPKPLLMGEYGANRSIFPSIASAAQAIRDELRASCDYGFTGWGLWTWDTTEQKDYWNATDSSGAMNGVVAPSVNPSFCPMVAAGLFMVSTTVYNSNGSHYCVFDTFAHYTSLTGRTDENGIPSYARLPATMVYDGVCH